MKILIVPTSDWVGHPFPSRLHHIFERLSHKHEIHVVRFSFYPQKKLETNTIVHEAIGIKTENPGLYYVINAYSYHNLIKQLISKVEINRVVISNLLSGYIAAKATKNRCIGVFDLSDFFPASGAGYYFSQNSSAGKTASFILEKIMRNTMQSLKNVITCSHKLQEYVKKVGIKNSFILSNGVDESFLTSKRDGKELREKYGLEGYTIIGYIGSIEFWLDMNPLLQAIKKLASKHMIKLLLVGKSLRTIKASEIRKKIVELGISQNIVWLDDFVPYNQVPEYIAAMDICTIPFNLKHPVAYYSAPNKLWEYLAMGKLVITTPIPEPIIQAGPWIEKAFTAKDYERIIKDYIKEPDKYQKKIADIKPLLWKNTWTEIATKYEQILQSMIRMN